MSEIRILSGPLEVVESFSSISWRIWEPLCLHPCPSSECTGQLWGGRVGAVCGVINVNNKHLELISSG